MRHDQDYLLHLNLVMIELRIKKAFRIIRRNYGCPGNDGITIKIIKKNYTAYYKYLKRQLEQNTYSFSKPRRVKIIDYKGNHRNIFVYNILDRWVQQCIKLYISPSIELVLRPYVFGYRRGKKLEDALNYVLSTKPKFILMIDVYNFFDTIDRDILFETLSQIQIPPETLNLISKAMAHTFCGLPQGNCLSPILSNVYLSEVDKQFSENYARYSDDLIFGLSSEGECLQMLNQIIKALDKFKLKINQNKIRLISEPTIQKCITNF